jgi:hypothetical protein
MSKLSMTPDQFLMEYYRIHPQGPRIAIYDRSDTKMWKSLIPLLVQLDTGEFHIGHVDYVHYRLLEEDNVGRPGDH